MQTIAQHLKSRYMDTDLHTVWVSEELRCATFPLWNVSGQIVGYQRYQPEKEKMQKNDPTEGRYFTRSGSKAIGTYGKEKWGEPRVGVWGLESWNLTDTLFLTEGIFDACRLTSNSRASAIAVLTCTISPALKNWLWTVRQHRKVVAICDNDSSGLKLRVCGHQHIVVPEGDLGDASDDYVDQLIKEHST